MGEAIQTELFSNKIIFEKEVGLIEKDFEFFIVLLTIPLKTFPGPISTNFSTPFLDIFIRLSLHFTEE